jgi:mono/diheme cytochrome c family protein
LDKSIPGLSPQSAAPKIRKPKRLPMRTTVSAMVFTFAVSAACADATNGEHLAQRWCASCHTVAREQTSARSAARSFATIARSPDFGREKLAIFLLLFHPKMPETSLTQSEASDLAEYIASLGRAE